MGSILIVEDERPINDLIKMNLSLVGYQCIQVFNGMDALKEIHSENNKIDLIILDIMLPLKNGFEVMKESSHIPVLFLTAKDNLDDKIKAFSLGAEDYMTKPFEILELIARVNVLLRRNSKEKEVEIDHIRVDLKAHKVYDHGKLVELKPQEYGLLEVLITNRNLALSREKLIELAWGYDYEGDTRTVDVHIQKIRKKLALEHRIKTVYKLGYRLEL